MDMSLFFISCLLATSLSIEQKRFLDESGKEKSSPILWMILRHLDKLDNRFVNVLKQNHEVIKKLQKHAHEIAQVEKLTEANKKEMEIWKSNKEGNTGSDTTIKEKIEENKNGINNINKTLKNMNTKLEQQQNQINTFHSKFSSFENLVGRLDAMESKLKEAKSARNAQQKEINDLKTKMKSLDKLKDQLGENAKKVGFTACARRGTVYKGQNMIFSSIKYSYGFKTLSSITSTGVFTCEEDGLYLITIIVTSNNRGRHFYLYRNNSENVAKLYIPYASGYNTGSASVVVKLSKNDTLKLQSAVNDINVAQAACISHMTLVKIK